MSNSYSKILEGFVNEFGTPNNEFHVPETVEVKIVGLYPEEEDDPYGIVLCTIGLSSSEKKRASTKLELSIHMPFDEKTKKNTIRIYSSFIKKYIISNIPFWQGKIVETGSLFRDTQHSIILKNTIFEGFEVSDSDSKYWVDIFRIFPITKDETDSLRLIKDVDRNVVFSQIGAYPKADDRVESKYTLENTLNSIWSDISLWHREKETFFGKNLDQSVNKDLEDCDLLKRKLGSKMPLDLLLFLSENQPKFPLNEYKLISPKGIGRILDSPHLKHIQKDQSFLPFAEDSEGNMIGIVNYEKKESKIGYWELDEGLILTDQTSFLKWLFDYKKKIQSGVYQIDQEGFLYQ